MFLGKIKLEPAKQIPKKSVLHQQMMIGGGDTLAPLAPLPPIQPKAKQVNVNVIEAEKDSDMADDFALINVGNKLYNHA